MRRVPTPAAPLVTPSSRGAASARLPGSRGVRVVLELSRQAGLLEATARVVYGEPPVAEIVQGELRPLGGLRALPPRNRQAERHALASLERELGLRPGRRTRLEGERAARFVADRLPSFSGEVLGSEAARSYTISEEPLAAQVGWRRGSLRCSVAVPSFT